MTKILIWIGVVFVLLFALRLLNVAKAKRRNGVAGRGPASAPPPESMVRCAHCGVYLPQKDAIPGPTGPTCGDPACTQPR
jgi:uncharacterized protein